MGNNLNKPVSSPIGCGCAVFNDPVMTDGVVDSPLSGGDTYDLIIPESAFRIHFIAEGTPGDAAATVSRVKGNMQLPGSITIPCGVQVSIDIGGGNSPAGLYFDYIRVVATSATCFWFDCETPGGA